MHRFNGYDIELTRGDSLQFRVTITGRELPQGTAALFTVRQRPRDENAVIEKQLAVDADGVVLVGLASDDTDITPRTYYWDLRVLMPLGDGTFEVRTPMEYATFTILEVVGNV
jgi:hypothetical protein